MASFEVESASGGIAQVVRVADSRSVGWRFESFCPHFLLWCLITRLLKPVGRYSVFALVLAQCAHAVVPVFDPLAYSVLEEALHALAAHF